jgi:hypothetical protein
VIIIALRTRCSHRPVPGLRTGPGRPILATLLLFAILSPPGEARAQWIQGVELGGGVRHAVYDGGVGLKNATGAGGRLGLMVRPALSLELDWSFQTPRPDGEPAPVFIQSGSGSPRVGHDLVQLRLVREWSLGDRTGLLAGLGYSYDRYYREREVGVSGGGPGGLLGARVLFSDVLSLRLEGTAYRIGSDPDRPIPRPSAVNLGLQAGLSYTFRGREVERIIELPPPPPDTVIVVRPPGTPPPGPGR